MRKQAGPFHLFLLMAGIFAVGSFSTGARAMSAICNGVLDDSKRPVDQVFVPTDTPIPAQEPGTFRLLQFNVENLFEMVGHFDLVTPHTYNLDGARPPKSKPDWKLRWIMQIMNQISPDLAVWEEVEDVNAMKYAQQKFPLPGFTPYLIPGNDSRGINIGMWVKDGAYSVRYETNKDVKWHDPVTNSDGPVFSRDVPAMIISDKTTGKPALIILGNHEKSQRDRPGDPGSEIWRTAQYHAMEALALKYQQTYGPQVAVVSAGDFNADVQKSPESQVLSKNFKSAFALAHETHKPADIITQTFFPQNGAPKVDSQLDDIKILNGSPVSVVRARVVRYHNLAGNVVPLPDSYDARNKQPSDHLPILADLKLTELLTPPVPTTVLSAEPPH